MIHVLISNKIIFYEAPEEVKEWCRNNLILTNPKYQQLIKMDEIEKIQRYHVPQFIYMFVVKGSDYIIPRGCMYALWPIIKKYPYEVSFNEDKKISICDKKSTYTLRGYQEKAVDAMVKAKGGILVCPCSGGKTLMASEIMHRIGLRTLFLVHTTDLLNQAKKSFLSAFPTLKVGTITDGKVELGEDITFSTVQTISAIEKSVYEDYFNIVIIDECHHVCNTPTHIKMFGKVIENTKARYVYGLTATPYRSDTLTNSMYAIIGLNRIGAFSPTYEIGLNELDINLARYEPIMLNTERSLTAYSEADGSIDYKRLIDYLTQNKTRNEEICENICKDGFVNSKHLVLCIRVEECQNIYNRLIELGARAVLITGKTTSAKERKRVLIDDKEGKTWNVIVSTYSLAKEGLDIPILSVLHLASPQKNKGLLIQCCGRIERKYPGKATPIVYDYVDKNIPYCMMAYLRVRRNILKNRLKST